jgi:TPR repeat protein
MPEVPENMQQGLANLELEARSAEGHRMSSASTISSQSPYYNQSIPHTRESSYSSAPRRNSGPGYTARYDHTNASIYQNLRGEYTQQLGGLDSPKFSPFPKLINPGPNVPLSDEDKEEVLERARPLVLKSSDPEMQLAWAQDALSWVEITSQYAKTLRTEEGQPARSITPNVEHQLRVDALNIVNFLADQHHPKAEFMRGMWLEFGKFGYRVDKKEAFLAYRRAAEKHYARAEYRIGMQYESSNNSAKAIEHYQKGVAMKDSASNYRLGMMNLLGQHGMPQNYQRGVDLIRFAADTADENAPQGAYVYGMLFSRELSNISVPEQVLPYDLNEAKLFIEKAAYLGFAKAQLKMAQAYELGSLDVKFDAALSLHYNALAARQGEAEADMAISKWFLCGCEHVFEKNEELAFTYAKRAAGNKMATAEFAMGYFYEVGIYVQQDLRESEVWYQKAAEHGNKDAVGRIDSIKKNNAFSKKDHEQVAIQRIKSTYGSQRGGRPDRFKQQPPPPMPTMAEDMVDMPDPRNSYAAPQLRPPKNLPPRPVSAAPYPDDDAPPRLGPTFNSAPYPHEQGLRPSPRPGPQADRPTSAFGIRPLTHSNTETYGTHLGKPTEPMRPSTSMGNMAVPAGRGGNPGGRVVSGGWEPQLPKGYREPTSHQPPTLPPVDLRRPANFDQGGPGKLQKPAPLNMNKAQPPQPPQNQGYPSNPSQKPAPQQGYDSRPIDPAVKRRDPAANQYTRPERGSSMTPISAPSPMNQRPERFDSMQSPVHSMQSPVHSMQSPVHSMQSPVHSMQSPVTNPSRANQRPMPTHTMSSQSHDSRPTSVAPSVASGTSAASGPPKKTGPATFEEMGIPAGKNESDCVSSSASVLLVTTLTLKQIVM